MYTKRGNIIDTSSYLPVVSRGFEPRQTEPKTVVLPLHHETIRCFILKALQR